MIALEFEALHLHGFWEDIYEHMEILLLEARERSKFYPVIRQKYVELKTLCEKTRSYEIPPEFYAIINTDNRINWTAADTEVARVIVKTSKPQCDRNLLLSNLVSRIDQFVSFRKPHIYRSLKKILRQENIIDGVIQGLN